ncbi:S41 family peptidase [Qipengyuania sp.]|uniref:S41 family peptidase n=1 Tax=Qipengyuania sp. TaxID=2004515 RepID=UPI0035C87ACC
MVGKIALSALAVALMAASPAAEQDWAAALRTDAQALHDLVDANHPGPVNPLDPEFTQRNDQALAQALARADRVQGYPGYLWAMRAYIASFDDGHVMIRSTDAAPDLQVAWPGFLTGYDDDGRQIVRTVADDAALPLGAELRECDGTSVAELMERNVGDFRGRWDLHSQRMIHGGRMFIDVGNPFISRPQQCVFSIEGSPRTVTLQWRAISDEELAERFAATAARYSPDIGTRTFPSGTRWYSLSDFDGDLGSDAGQALAALIGEMREDADPIRSAPRIVLDLRGNGGGSSDWSKQIARIIWGEEKVASASGGSDYVEWRASPANIAAMDEYRRDYASAPDAPREVVDWLEGAVKGMTIALAADEPLWREPSSEERPEVQGATDGAGSPQGPVYILTDWVCASACLDAVDLWRSLGAIQVGQETGADTLYMDVRDDPLPSGLATVGMPMKVYRGRPRGINEPWKPVHPFEGSMRSTEDIEAWIVELGGG